METKSIEDVSCGPYDLCRHQKVGHYLALNGHCVAYAIEGQCATKYQIGGDMKSDVVMVEIVLIVDFIFMFLCLDLVLYIEGYYTFYISHYLG